MDDEKLISLVSGYPEIYDLQNENYMNHVRKNNIWNEIGTLLGVSDTICKEKWKELRDAYHRSLKRRKSKSGDGAKKIKQWRFESQMEFLRPHFQERISKTNIENTMISDDDNRVSDIETATSTSSAPVNSPRPASRTTSTPDLETPQPSSKTITSTILKNMTARKKNKQQLPQSQVANVLEKYLNSRTTSPSVESINPIHSFFKAMADTVATLSPDLQLKVKNQVYSIVSQTESENLRQTSSVSTEFESFTPNITLPQQEQPMTIVPQNENKTNDETQYILQPSQSILQPQSQFRFRYYINHDGKITYENSKCNE